MILASVILRELLLSSLAIAQEVCHIPFSYKLVQVPVYLNLQFLLHVLYCFLLCLCIIYNLELPLSAIYLHTLSSPFLHVIGRGCFGVREFLRSEGFL